LRKDGGLPIGLAVKIRPAVRVGRAVKIGRELEVLLRGLTVLAAVTGVRRVVLELKGVHEPRVVLGVTVVLELRVVREPRVALELKVVRRVKPSLGE
jgi:hypothetical protein